MLNFGKSNPTVLKALFKVVIDDTLYEVSGVIDYIKFLNKHIKRLEQIEKYDKRMQKCKSEKDKEYYKEGINMLLAKGEEYENYKDILKEYREAVILRKQVEKDLFNEVKIIKRLKV